MTRVKPVVRPPLSESRGYFQRRLPVRRWLRRQERRCCERLTIARPLHRPFLAPAFVILVGARERQGRGVRGQACVQGGSGCLRTEEPRAAWPARVCSAFLRRGQNGGPYWKPPSGNKSKVWRGARPVPPMSHSLSSPLRALEASLIIPQHPTPSPGPTGSPGQGPRPQPQLPGTCSSPAWLEGAQWGQSPLPYPPTSPLLAQSGP